MMASDREQYLEALRKVESGNEQYKTRVAFFLLRGRGGVDADADEAVALLTERSAAGDREAKWMLGVCYEFGLGTEQDIGIAERLYTESANARSEVGMFLSEVGNNERGSGVLKVKPWSLLFGWFCTYHCFVTLLNSFFEQAFRIE